MISVITPVFNAERFLNKTIQSVLEQPEVSEYILVDDGSIDKSLEILKNWEKKDARIKVLQHPYGKNHGRARTRNLGIKNVTKEYVAFLDSDDFYLPDRFKFDILTLESKSDIDGVYNAIGAYKYEDFSGSVPDSINLTSFERKIAPDELFEQMSPIGNAGRFSGNGITIRFEIFNKVGFFSEKLAVAEDTNLWLKMALSTKLVSGNLITPVAMRGLHGDNVFNQNKIYQKYRVLMYDELLGFAGKKKVNRKRIGLIWDKLIKQFKVNYPDRYGELKLILFTLRKFIEYPNLFLVKSIRNQIFVSLNIILKKTISN